MVRYPQSRGFCYQGFFRASIEYIASSFFLLFLSFLYWSLSFFFFFLFILNYFPQDSKWFDLLILNSSALVLLPLLCENVDALGIRINKNLFFKAKKKPLRIKMGLLNISKLTRISIWCVNILNSIFIFILKIMDVHFWND